MSLKYFLTSILFIRVFIACSQDNILISGIFEKGVCDTVILVYPERYAGEEHKKQILPVKDKSFSVKFTLPSANEVQLQYCGQKRILFLEPGDDLSITINGEAIVFSGKGAGNNKCLNQFYTQFRDNFDEVKMNQKLKEFLPDVIEMELYEDQKKQKEFFKTYAGSDQLSAAFLTFSEALPRYYYYGWLVRIPFSASGTEVLQVHPLPAVMLEKIDKASLGNEQYMSCRLYRQFLDNYFLYLAHESAGFAKFSSLSLLADKKLGLVQTYLKNAPYLYVSAGTVLSLCEEMSPAVLKKYSAAIEQAEGKGIYSKLIREKCGKWIDAKEKKRPGSSETSAADPLLKMKFTGTDGKEKTLADLKGKVLYIDFWASWCMPCRQQFPHARELKKKLSNKQQKQVEFVYISIDDTQDAWKKGIEQNKMEGFLIWAPGGWNSEVAGKLGIGSIPRYMIVDKKGRIVLNNAPRPSQPETLDELLKLLE